ncbi:MAG: hypothetical protein ACFE8N_05570, partial [Promethearchaeota archaeon]
DKIDELDIKPQFYSKESQKPLPNVVKEPLKQPPTPTQSQTAQNLTIFGKPQTKIDPDLKICRFCNSKIKKMWSICPICGENL